MKSSWGYVQGKCNVTTEVHCILFIRICSRMQSCAEWRVLQANCSDGVSDNVLPSTELGTG
jgi:hypothetical protein